MREEDLRQKLGVVCAARRLIMGEAWVQKVLQLKQVNKIAKHLSGSAHSNGESQVFVHGVT